MILKQLTQWGCALALGVALAGSSACMKPDAAAKGAADAAAQRAAESAARRVADLVSKLVFDDELERRKLRPRMNAKKQIDAKIEFAEKVFERVLGAAHEAHPMVPEHLELRVVRGKTPDVRVYGGVGLIMTDGLIDLVQESARKAGDNKPGHTSDAVASDLMGAALAHELAHVVQGHAVENLLANTALVAELASQAPRLHHGIPTDLRMRVATALNLYGHFLRDQELQADATSLELLDNIDIERAASIRLLRALRTKGETLPIDHPTLQARIDNLKPLISKLSQIDRCARKRGT